MRGIVTYMVVLLLIAAVLRLEFYFGIVYLFAMVYLLARLWVRRQQTSVQIRRELEPRAFIGDTITVRLSLTNTDWLPLPWLTAVETLPIALSSPPFHREVVTLGPKETQTLHYELRCQRRGYYAIGPLRLQTGDLFGITSPSPLQVEPARLTVYPRVVPLNRLRLASQSPLVALPARSPLFEDPSRIMSVRPYQRGDSPRRVHWTATARTGQMVVKNYQPSIARETLLCLDMREDGYAPDQLHTASELAIVVTASLATHIVVNEKLPVGLAMEAWDPMPKDQVRFRFPPRKERSHLTQILEVLARAQTTSGVSFHDLLQAASLELSWGGTLTIITGKADSWLLENLLVLRRAGLLIHIILVRPGHSIGEFKQQAAILGVSVDSIWHEHDLETWL